MITIRKAQDRGTTQTSWLQSYHTFSFAEYHDSQYMGLSSLRVINDDVIQPGAGFGTHPHHNMEIITYIIQGELKHQDSMGNGSIIRPGEIQRMSAGTGISHSEHNHSNRQSLHLLQIWIKPNILGLTPSYEQKAIPQHRNGFILIGCPEGVGNAITIHQDVDLYAAYLDKEISLHHTFEQERRGWIQLIKGKAQINGKLLFAGDGAAITDEEVVYVDCIEDAELLLFDLAP